MLTALLLMTLILLLGWRKWDGTQLNCGLAGVFGDTFLSDKEKDPVRLLMFLNMLRGTDSTGLFTAWQRGGKQRLSYEANDEHALDFLSWKKVDDLFKLPLTTLIASHTRSATLGEVNKHNSQPILEGNTIGCHNGTVGAFKSAAIKEGCSDSRILIRTIDSHGIDEVVQMMRVPSLISGAAAITWVDLKLGTFNIYRNEMRPLFIMMDKEDSLFYWSSERVMLEFTAKRMGLSCNEPYPLLKDTLVTYELGDLSTYKERKIEYKPTYSMSSKKPFQRKPLHLPAGPKDPPWNNDEVSELLPGDIVDEGALEERAEAARGVRKNWAEGKLPRFYDHRREKFYSLYRGFNDDLFPAIEISKKISTGCTMCTATGLTVTSPIWWLGRDNFICSECRQDPMVIEYAANGNSIWKGQLCGHDEKGSNK